MVLFQEQIEWKKGQNGSSGNHTQEGEKRNGVHFCPEDGENIFLRISRKLLPDYTVTSQKTVIFIFFIFISDIIYMCHIIMPVGMHFNQLSDPHCLQYVLDPSTCSKKGSFVLMHRTTCAWDLCRIIFWTSFLVFGLRFLQR
jgi:hypothetical protein